ncbi:MAG: 50S ribosomal protein L22 [Thermoplasmata archaeon]|nr:50S ribosomal protein L22 [Thermoplasmata archaeon]
MVGYTAHLDPERTAKAYGRELDISPKKAVEVCRAIRGMRVPEAKEFLEAVIEKRRPVPYYRYRRGTANKKGIPVAGGYPQKVARAILKVLESAEANAEHKELDPDEMRIAVIAAHKGRVFENYIPRAHGRATPFNREMTNIEIILEEVEE